MTAMVKGFGRTCVRKPLMQEPAVRKRRAMGICALARCMSCRGVCLEPRDNLWMGRFWVGPCGLSRRFHHELCAGRAAFGRWVHVALLAGASVARPFGQMGHAGS